MSAKAEADTGRNDVRRVVVIIAALVFALAFYFIVLGKVAIQLIGDDRLAVIGLGVGVLVLPLIGVWTVVATIRAGLQHQHLARLAWEGGFELDVDDLPRMPSGRVERAAADALFLQVKDEWEADPDSWRVNYRLARAYDYAGDRSRARETMRRAVYLESQDRS